MNIVKESRFVWFIVALFVIGAVALSKKGQYHDDDDDQDRAFTETPPTPPPSPTSCFPGFAYAMFGDTGVSMAGGSRTDSYDSSGPPYTNRGSVGTNGCSAGSINLNNGSRVGGYDYYGNTCPASTITIASGAGDRGSRDQTPSNLSLPAVVIPTVGTALGACAACTPVPNNTYSTVSGAVTFGPGTYVITTLTADVTVTAGPVLIYVLDGGFTPTSINNTTGKPANLVFQVAGTTAINAISGTYALYAPGAPISISAGGTNIYGAVVGSSVAMSNGTRLHYDKQLAVYSGGGYACTSSEVSRSSPVIASISGVDNIVQGTFNTPKTPPDVVQTLADVASWTFPYLTGHFRARTAASFTLVGTAYSAGTITFDATDTATGLPLGASAGVGIVVNTASCGSTTGAGTALIGSCRRIFTNTNTPNGLSWHPAVYPLLDTNAAVIGARMIVDGGGAGQIAGISGGTYYQTMIRTVLNAKFGGVDRSTAAVIGTSSVAGGARPTVAYVGGTDGMLHAICASTGGSSPTTGSAVCPRLGAELWAFLPGTQLPLLASNTQRIDGSPRVIDAFGDFSTLPANATRSWHTILTFQTGFEGTSVGATYALDITDPAAPVVLWEYATPSAVGPTETGVGLLVAAGQYLKGGLLTNVAVVETNNGGNGGAGVVTTALQLENGAKLWQIPYLYPSPPRSNPADLPLPDTGVPGGAVGVDISGAGTWSDVVLGDLYGNLWRLNIVDGSSRNGANTPVFSFSINRRPIGVPPAIYASGNSQYAAFASGGYVDPNATQWSGNTQYLEAVQLNSTGGTVSELTAAAPGGRLAVNQTLTLGDREFSQPIVIGGKLYLTSDANDVNNSSYGSSTSTSHLMSVDTTTGAMTTVVLAGGSAGSLVATTGGANGAASTIYNSSANSQSILHDSGGTQVSGTISHTNSVDTSQTPKITRNLWLRTQ